MLGGVILLEGLEPEDMPRRGVSIRTLFLLRPYACLQDGRPAHGDWGGGEGG